MLRRMTFMLALVLTAGVGFAQEAEEVLDLEPHFVNLIGAFVPVIAYVVVFFIRKGMGKLPDGVKPFLPMVGPVLGLVVGIINGQVDGATSALLAAAWGGAATVVYEIQKGISKAVK